MQIKCWGGGLMEVHVSFHPPFRVKPVFRQIYSVLTKSSHKGLLPFCLKSVVLRTALKSYVKGSEPEWANIKRTTSQVIQMLDIRILWQVYLEMLGTYSTCVHIL